MRTRRVLMMRSVGCVIPALVLSVALSACGGEEGDMPDRADTAPACTFSQVTGEMIPVGAGLRSQAEGEALVIDLDVFSMRKGGPEAPAVLSIGLEPGEGCALSTLTARLEGTATMGAGASARLTMELGQSTAMHGWERAGTADFTARVTADAGTGLGAAAKGGSVALTLTPRFYGPAEADAGITLERITLTAGFDEG